MQEVGAKRFRGLLQDHLSLSTRTYRMLRELILKGEYSPGQRLIEGALARDLGVSRVPVREAFRRLQQDSLVEARPQSGTLVATFTLKEVEEVYRIRASLEAWPWLSQSSG